MRGMLHRLGVVALLAGSLALAGCETTKDVGTKIEEVQSKVALACSFVPTAATIVALFSKSGGEIGDMVRQICDALTKKKAARGARPMVNGVEIRGYRI